MDAETFLFNWCKLTVALQHGLVPQGQFYVDVDEFEFGGPVNSPRMPQPLLSVTSQSNGTWGVNRVNVMGSKPEGLLAPTELTELSRHDGPARRI